MDVAGAEIRAESSGEFDWRVYADATAAGLTALIPVPLVDLFFEATFSRRMPAAIARVRGRSLPTVIRMKLTRRTNRWVSLEGCLTVPLMAGRYLLRRIWRKVVYVLAVADAASLVSAYWHRAYLMDHVIRSGHLDQGADADRAIEAFNRVLRDADTSPLTGLARQVVANSRHVGRLMVRARRRGATETIEEMGEIFREHWGAAERSLRSVAIRYNEMYVGDVKGEE